MEPQPIIEIVPYNSDWPQLYEQEAEKIKQLLGNSCVTIHHIGSTAVPGLNAKPIIDILVVVKNILDLDKHTPKLTEIGYTAKGEHGIPFRRFFHKGTSFRTHNVHVYEEASPEIERHLHFRNSLRKNPEVAHDYAQLKIALAKQHPHDINAYASGKESFIKKIDQQIVQNNLRLLQACTESDWQAVKEFRKGKFEAEYIHMLLLQGTAIIGYASISKSPLSIECILLKSGFEMLQEEFLQLLTRWLSHQMRQT